jgi:hypothetical protein
METIMTDLFTPMKLGGLALPNRIWMSAMTRARATPDNIPTLLMAEYYAQRASAGLIVTECTAVSEQGKGVINGRRSHRLPALALRPRCAPRYAGRRRAGRAVTPSGDRQVQVSRPRGGFPDPT